MDVAKSFKCFQCQTTFKSKSKFPLYCKSCIMKRDEEERIKRYGTRDVNAFGYYEGILPTTYEPSGSLNRTHYHWTRIIFFVFFSV